MKCITQYEILNTTKCIEVKYANKERCGDITAED